MSLIQSHRLNHLDGIIFAEDFDLDEGNSVIKSNDLCVENPLSVEGEPPPQMYSEHDLMEAIAAEEGRVRALVQAEFALTQTESIARSMASIVQNIQSVRIEATAASEQNAEAIGRIIFGILSSFVPRIAAAHDATETVKLVKCLIRKLHQKPIMQIQMSESCLPIAAPLIEQLRMVEGVEIELSGLSNIKPGDSIVSWGNGCVLRSSTRIYEEITEIFERLDMLPDRIEYPSGVDNSQELKISNEINKIPPTSVQYTETTKQLDYINA